VLPGQHPGPPGCVDEEVEADPVAGAAGVGELQLHRPVAIEFDSAYGRLLDHRNALIGRVAEQNLVVSGPVHLPGPRVRVDQFRPVEQPLVVAPVEHRAPLHGEAGRRHLVERAGHPERRQTGRQQRFADVVPRELFAFQQQDVDAVAGE